MSTRPSGCSGEDRGAGSEFLEALARRYTTALRRFFERREPGLGSESEDLAQEVFERLARRKGGGEIANIEGYLFQTAANVLTDRSRRRLVRFSDSHVEYDEEYHALEDFSAERVISAREELELVVRTLEELPERTRAAFVLHRFEGLKYAEIARRLGVSVSAVEKHIIRALRHIGDRLRSGQ